MIGGRSIEVYGIVGVLLMIALGYDLKTYRVPNWLIVVGCILGISCRTLAGGLEGSLEWMVGVGAIGILFIPFALLHMFGAGDVKLFMVTGGFFYHTICSGSSFLWGSFFCW